MGLTVEVGHLADMVAHDPEGAAMAGQDYDRINEALADEGLDALNEPTDCEPWSADMIG